MKMAEPKQLNVNSELKEKSLPDKKDDGKSTPTKREKEATSSIKSASD